MYILCRQLIQSYNHTFSECLRRVENITGKTIRAYDLDLNDDEGLRKVFREV